LRSISLISFILLFSSFLYSYEFKHKVTSGFRYDSNIDVGDRTTSSEKVSYGINSNYINITTVHDANVDQAFKIGKGDRGGLFTVTAADLSVQFSKDKPLILDYSFFSDGGNNHPKESALDQQLELSYSKDFSENSYYNVSGGMHYAAKDYISFRSLFIDIFTAFDIYYDLNEDFSVFSSIKTSYYKSLDNETYMYLTGPAVRAEAGGHLYPEHTHSLKVVFGGELFWFRDEKHQVTDESGKEIKGDVIGISHKYRKLYSRFEFDYLVGDFTLNVASTISYDFWIGIDSRSFIGWEKRRVDKTIAMSTSLLYEISQNLEVKVYYAFQGSNSNFGSKPDDYTDFSYQKHVAGLNGSVKF